MEGSMVSLFVDFGDVIMKRKDVVIAASFKTAPLEHF
jgi:hypothetical protein